MLSDRISKSISFVRYPLIVLVVFIHVPRIMNGGVIYTYITSVISEVVASIAVPCFFIISGFLFFDSCLTRYSYLNKIKKRLQTLLLPYIVWNAIFIVFVIILNIHDYTYTIGNVSACFWDCHYSFLDTNSHSPIDYPLWYVRDLIVCCLFSPIIYVSIKYLKFTFPLLMIILWICDVHSPIVGLSIISLAFFSVGAFLRSSSFDINEKTVPWGRSAVLIFLILSFLSPLMPSSYISRIVTLIGSISVLFAADFIIKSKPILATKVTSLNRTVFFIFASHSIIVKYLYRIFNLDCVVVSELPELFIYFFVGLLTIIICHILYRVCIKILPKSLNIMIGVQTNK